MPNIRQTTVRLELLALLKRQSEPLSVPAILGELKKKKLIVNKTTIYRQLTALSAEKIVQEVRLDERGVRYEYAAPDDHHHHLVCLNCGNIDDISFPDDLERQEAAIAKQKKFRVFRHSLEFFGYCKHCAPLMRVYQS